MNYTLPYIPNRTEKPRNTGLTMMMDKGLSVRQVEDFLEQAAQVLKPGGRLVVMSYHSLEDRLVKNYMKRGSFSGEVEKDFFGNIQKPFTEVTRHPIVADAQECERNSRARSAKLRIAKRNG